MAGQGKSAEVAKKRLLAKGKYALGASFKTNHDGLILNPNWLEDKCHIFKRKGMEQFAAIPIEDWVEDICKVLRDQRVITAGQGYYILRDLDEFLTVLWVLDSMMEREV